MSLSRRQLYAIHPFNLDPVWTYLQLVVEIRQYSVQVVAYVTTSRHILIPSYVMCMAHSDRKHYRSAINIIAVVTDIHRPVLCTCSNTRSLRCATSFQNRHQKSDNPTHISPPSHPHSHFLPLFHEIYSVNT